jgi:hypothetical protein
LGRLVVVVEEEVDVFGTGVAVVIPIPPKTLEKSNPAPARFGEDVVELFIVAGKPGGRPPNMGGNPPPKAGGMPIIGCPPPIDAMDSKKAGSESMLRIIGFCNMRPNSGFAADICRIVVWDVCCLGFERKKEEEEEVEEEEEDG